MEKCHINYIEVQSIKKYLNSASKFIYFRSSTAFQGYQRKKCKLTKILVP
jgi:hypothetical protein